MKRFLLASALTASALLAAASPAAAEFGFSEFDVAFNRSDSSPVTQAGSHPFEMTTSLGFISEPTEGGGQRPEQAAKDVILTQPPGFAGNPTAVPRCETKDFLDSVEVKPNKGGGFSVPACPAATAVGLISIAVASNSGTGEPFFGAVYNLAPPPHVAAKLGFRVGGAPVAIELGVKESPPYNIVGGPTNITRLLEVISSRLTLWGVPADPAHDSRRGLCLDPVDGSSLGDCEANISEVPFLTMPRSCTGPLRTGWAIDSWQNPGAFLEGFAETHDSSGNPLGLSGCGKLGFGPEVSIKPTTVQAESSSGLDISIDSQDEGLANAKGIAQADIEATRFAFPAGMTLNPSAAEGLGVCSKSQYEAESLTVHGCPDASKLGSLEADTPVLENHTLHGSLFLAQQDDPTTTQPGAENPFDSLFAAYLVIRDPELGVFVKLPSKIETDEATGQVVASAKDLPPYPLSHVGIHLRSGPRAPFITPPACGPHSSQATLTPSSGAPVLASSPGFQIESGPNGAPCPTGAPPFDPGFEAGSANGAAAAYSPFAMRLTRSDGQQDLTKFSATLPPGVTGKLAGIAKCPDQAIAGAKAKTGKAEQASPSCPASSLIGHVLAGAGVGTALTYVPGSLYLAGPYNGAPLSVAAIVPAVAGPFDVGTVVTRVALRVSPQSAQVEVDGAASDPIPHILKGIPVKVREIRVLTDRPDFTLNPTSCDPFATKAQIFGSGLDPFNPTDDAALAREARYQAASCASLPFKPKLDLKLKGGTKRGAHPALTATYTPRAGDANLKGLVLRLPHSAFLDQAHIRTICTRVQFAQKACPKGAQYGSIKAFTPLLDEPLQGPVYLRSSNHNLPDLVFDLHGLVDIEVATRIDSQKGGIRTTLEGAPDAPISKVVLTMQGAKKGLIVNSTDLCAAKHRADAQFTGQNGKQSSARPVMQADCPKGRKGKAKRGK
jgi:hypothetical protein